MNDELKREDDRLQLATSRSLTSDGMLDGETAAAREAFLAFGCAVESAARDFDEAALLQRLVQTCTRESRCEALPKRPRNWWPLIASGALAAGMLLAMGQIARERQPLLGSPAATPQIAGQVQSKAPLVAAPDSIWSDPLDDEIALAAATIQQLSPAHRGFDGSLLEMNDQLRSLSRELSGETL